MIGKKSKPDAPKPMQLKVFKRVFSISERAGKVSFELDGLGMEGVKKVEKFVAKVKAEPD